MKKKIIAWNKGKKMPHTKEWEEKRLAAVRKSASNKVWARGYKRPRSHTQPMLDALKRKRKQNPHTYREIAIRNLSRNKSPSLSGMNSPQWRGGITKESVSWRNKHWREYQSFVKSVYQRDSGKCKNCGSKEDVEVHHIIPISFDRQFAFVRANGVLLCLECHKKTDSFGFKGIARSKTIGSLMFHIKTIPHHWQDYATVGNWFLGEKGGIAIFVSDMSNKDYEFFVAIHEMVEVFLCKARGIFQKKVDAFDMRFEKMRSKDDDSEPGDDPRAPYQNEHNFSTAVERLVCAARGIKWARYEAAVDKLFK